MTQGVSHLHSEHLEDAINKNDTETFKRLFDAAKRKFAKGSTDLSAPYVFEQTKATHLGYVNSNNSFYPDKFGDQNAKTWMKPFPKPVLINHDLYSEPIGRHTDASYVPFNLTSSQIKNIHIPKGVIVTHSAILDSASMEKVLDGRYLTVSISASTNEVKCSICDQDWMNKNTWDENEVMCDHVPGRVYDRKLCYKITGPLDYKERSFVNTPADMSKSHYAGLTNYELILPKDQIEDQEYISSNMVYSKESPIIVDSAGYTLFLSKDKDGNYPTSKPFYAFTFNDEDNIELKIEDKDIDPPNTISNGPSDLTDDSNLPGSNHNDDDGPIEDKNQNTKSRKESVDMEWSTVSVDDALKNVTGLELYITDKVETRASELTSKANEDKTSAEADSKTSKTKFDDLKVSYDKLIEDSKTIAVDTIMSLYAQLEKTQYMKAVNDHKDDQEGLNDELKTMRENIAKRELNSLLDSVSDLKSELDAKMVDSSSDETPAGDGITTVTDGDNGSTTDDRGEGDDQGKTRKSLL